MAQTQQQSRFDVAGPADAPLVIFLHGAAWTRAMWAPQMQSLANDYRVAAIDLPGHGARAGEQFTLDAAIRAVDDVFVREARQTALLVGGSLGGYVAIAYAHAHPQRVARLVLSGSSVDYRVLGLVSWLDATISLKIVGERRLLAMQEKSVRGMFPPELAETLITSGFYFTVMPAAYRVLARHDYRALLKTYDGPVLILNGERDGINRRGERKLLAACQHGSLSTIANAGHGCNLEQPDAFSAEVRAFAQTLKA